MQDKLSKLSIGLLIAATSLAAQTPTRSTRLIDENSEGGAYRPAATVQQGSVYGGPFSRVSIGGSLNTFGPGVQITTNLADHFNLRASGNALYYSTNFNTSGFNANAKMNMATVGVAADIYPFPRHGFRVSPGILVVNNNRVNATAVAAGGTSIDFNDTTYYSATANSATGATPLNVKGSLGLNTTKPAFTLTTGWGNTIPRNGAHWSFPLEVGVGFVGAPSVNVSLSGWACQDQAQTECGNVQNANDGTAQDIQTSLAAQITKWKSDLDPLKTYPILSFGVAYSFPVHGAAGIR
ncbi:MAG TPA: hypothetical protein VHZ28_13225 [Terracidiphilus sp.]|jgi:hypothetical protein|nr:hypothetical protein [Terracidiphilus sp.]